MELLNNNWFIRARLKNRHLIMLKTLGDTSNLNLAAEKLGISQPAISKLLKELEEGLDVQLFERLPRGVKPTECGLIMIHYAKQLLKTLDNAFEEVSAIRQGLKGSVRIGTVLTPCTDLIPETLAKISTNYPNLDISVKTGSSDDLLQMLNNGEIDLSISRHNNDYNKQGFIYEPIYRTTDPLYPEPVMVCAGVNNPLVKKKITLSLANLANYDWVLPPNKSVMRDEFEAMFHKSGVQPPKQIITAENLLIITNLLEKSQIITLLPSAVMEHYMKYGLMDQVKVDETLQIELGKILKVYGLIHKGENLLSPASRAVLDLLRNSESHH